MGADGACSGFGVKVDLAGVVANLLACRPQAGAGVLHVGQTGDAGHAGNMRRPVAIEVVGDLKHLHNPVFLTAMAVAIDGLIHVERVSRLAEVGQGVLETGLVTFHPDQ